MRKIYSIVRFSGREPDAACRELAARFGGFVTLKILFFGECGDNSQYAASLRAFAEAVARHFGGKRNVPVVGYVAQKPLDAALCAEITYLYNAGSLEIIRGEHYVMCRVGAFCELITGTVLPSASAEGIAGQTASALERLGKILEKEGFTAGDILRQWNYIEGITRMEDGRQRYQAFNDARGRMYAGAQWESGYPAATGIGAGAGGVAVEAVAARGVATAALDNPLQAAAHRYSQHTLRGAPDPALGSRATPKFERGRAVAAPSGQYVYVSGTAAIRGEESLAASDAVMQARMTMENIARLVAESNFPAQGRRTYRAMRVYIKHEADMRGVSGYMDTAFPGVEKLYLHADVCRDELLVEVECIVTIE